MDLSILIPARNEMFLNNTIEDILAHIEGDTEIICVLDGGWPVDPIPDHERVTLIYHPVSVGQRAATNEAASISKAKYVMKCDAHCSFYQGFDVKLMEDMQDDWTMVPMMYNLHAFDWVCQECGWRKYQSPTPDACKECEGPVEREIVWIAKHNPETTAMRFDRDLKFQYWGSYKKRQKGDLVKTMSLLGACWMLTRDKYFELDICDEKHGSWGQQGTEVACKTWLSGGRLVCSKRTWFAHMFRTQGGDFGFPYKISGSDVNRAREYSHSIWQADLPDKMPKWDKAIFPLSWLIKKFAPVPEWEITKGIVYYTDNQLDPEIMLACQEQLVKSGLKIIPVFLGEPKAPLPEGFEKPIVVEGKRGPLTMFKQILAGLEAIDTDIVFFAEHDVLYHPSHFDYTPCFDIFHYNNNMWKVNAETGKALFHYSNHTSQLCAYRGLLLEHYRKRVQMVEDSGFSHRMGYEPGTHGRAERVDDYKAATWMSNMPNVDLRHKGNLTQTRWSRKQFRNQRFTKGWTIVDGAPDWKDHTDNLFSRLSEQVIHE